MPKVKANYSTMVVNGKTTLRVAVIDNRVEVLSRIKDGEAYRTTNSHNDDDFVRVVLSENEARELASLLYLSVAAMKEKQA